MKIRRLFGQQRAHHSSQKPGGPTIVGCLKCGDRKTAFSREGTEEVSGSLARNYRPSPLPKPSSCELAPLVLGPCCAQCSLEIVPLPETTGMVPSEPLGGPDDEFSRVCSKRHLRAASSSPHVVRQSAKCLIRYPVLVQPAAIGIRQ